MKKLFTLAAVMAFAVVMTACGGNNKKTNDAATETETQTETTAAPAAAASESSALDTYEKLINQMIELQPKLAKGDASAAQEYMKISEEMSKISEQLSQEIANMTPAQAQRFSELGQKLIDAANAAQ